MASEASLPLRSRPQGSIEYRTTPSSARYKIPAGLAVPSIPTHLRNPKVLTTLYQFPTLEPLAFLEYPSTHLHLPFRRDLLHRAIVYEGDKHRGWSTASTKWRSEVRGSGRKLRPQKGTGRARLGDKKSPMLRGGGVAFGPKPRDYTSALPRKLYDIAWRTALSYRYRRGELVVIDNASLEPLKGWDGPDDTNNWTDLAPYYVKHLFDRLGWGNANGRSMLVTKKENKDLESALEIRGDVGRARSVEKIDVKNLLEMGRVVIEKGALDHLLLSHQRDLRKPGVPLVGMGPKRSVNSQMLSEMAEESGALEQAMLDEEVGEDELEEMIPEEEEEEEDSPASSADAESSEGVQQSETAVGEGKSRADEKPS